MTTDLAQDPTISRLLHWLEQGGASFSKVQIGASATGERGLFAATDLAADEIFLRIPLSHLVTHKVARSSDIGRLLVAHPELDTPDLYMAAFLLQEKERGEASFWKPFLDVQPTAFPTHPYYYGESEFSLLKGSLLPEVLAVHRQVIEHLYLSAVKLVPEFRRFPLDQFVWAHLDLITRQFSPKLEGNSITCLAPVGDMINASNPWNSTYGWSPDGQFYEMKTRQAVARGQELATTYGNNSNLHQLRYYGFVFEHNPNNEVLVPFELPKEDPLLEKKLRMLGITDPSSRQVFSLPLWPDVKIITELVSELRIVHAQAEELAVLESAPDPLVRAKAMLSPVNEARVFRALATLCKAHIQTYETSMEEDTRLLQEGNLTLNARNCILLRRGEKQILKVYAEAG
ncbi:SET domain-containing histone-lysine N-methyltransferase [Hyalangium versicolor]|uniref:SET domain-containing histone-lysine N-methyltransferase n=1 Tax=Hyalangium versicolor TaxID=2861190 RepID=UPI001CCE6507|nr:SET domain-containing histone-lysine N-methyltransferase [Hyalangium versicolor]